ncbi:hypothetical protein GYMLUDRAFT_152933, partial [Collybiopsis luxurians FD-317 M1]
QDRTQKILGHNKKLRNQVAELKARLRSTKTGLASRSRKKKHVDSLLDYGKLVLWGKKYALAVSPWALSTYFMMSPSESSSPPPDSKERFASFEAYKAGGILELHKFLESEPEMRTQASNYSPFRDAFITETNGLRSTAVFNVCGAAPVIFASLNLPTNLWPRPQGSKRKDSEAFQKLLLFPNERKPKTLIPLYYPNLQKNASLLFMTEHLTDVSFFGHYHAALHIYGFELHHIGFASNAFWKIVADCAEVQLRE